MDGHRAKAGQTVVLAGLTGLRICRPRPPLANSFVCGPRLLAVADVAWPETGSGAKGRELLVADALPRIEHRNSSLLCCRPDVWATQSAHHGRILAVVGGSPLGGRLLRSLRHCRDRIPLHAPEAALGVVRDESSSVLHGCIPLRRH